MFTENLDQFFADFGVSATFSAETGLVIFDSPELQISGFGGDVISAEYKIKYKATLFSALDYGSSIVVNGLTYRVNSVNLIEDGALKEAMLSK